MTFNLQKKITLNILVVTLIFAFLGYIAILKYLPAILNKKLANKGVFIARSVTSRSISSILEDNLLALRTIIEEEKKLDSDIVYVFIVDLTGKILAHTFEGDFPTDLKEANSVSINETSNLQVLNPGKSLFYDIAAPIIIKGEMKGTVRVGLNNENMRKEINNAIGIFTGIIILGIVVTFLIGFVMKNLAVKSIKELHYAVEEIMEGNFEVKVDIKTNDEIQQLAEAFNIMVDSIKTDFKELNRAAEEIMKGNIEVKANVRAKNEIQRLAKALIAISTSIKNTKTNLEEKSEKLRIGEEGFKDIFDNAIDGTLLVDLENKKFLSGNKKICQMLEYTLEEIKTLGTMDIYPKEELQYVIEQFEKQKRKEIDIAKNIPLKRKYGTIFYADLSSASVNMGTKTYIVYMFRDITKQKQMEDELKKEHQHLKELVHERAGKLRENEEKFKLIFENSMDAIILIDSETGVIIDCNNTAEELLGRKKDDIIGLHQIKLYPPEKAEDYADVFENHTEKETVNNEVEIITKSGEIKPVRVSAKVTAIAEKPIIQKIFRDISVTKKMEKEFTTALTAAEKSKKEMQEQKEMFEAINNELDSFTYTVSHDLKEPLRGIETFSKFILEDYSSKLDEEGKNYLKRISAGVGRMRSLIDDLLAFSRISRVRNPYESVDANKLVKDIIKRLRPIIEEKKVKLEIDEELPFIYCDSTKIKEVFHNLISNAIKYNNKPEPIIEVGIVEKDKETKESTFYVKDNGIGIKKEHFDIIFQIFKRLHSRDEYGSGTGIGLAIVKKIIDEHKGKLWVESEEGKGTTFYFTVPKRVKNEEEK